MLSYYLDINFGFGEIGINTYKGDIGLSTDIQESFHLKTSSPKLNHSSTYPKIVDIDLSQCRTDMGYPQLYVAGTQWRDKAKLHALEYVGAKAAEGDALMAIEKGITIVDIVKSEFPDPPEVNIAAVPKTPPKITFEYGKMQKELSRGSVKVDVAEKPVSLDFKRAKVNISMHKNPYIIIKAMPKGKNIDSYT